MQRLRPPDAARGKLVVFVPRWLPAEWTANGLPHRVFPVLSSAALSGIDVTLLSEVQDGIDRDVLSSALDGADAAVVWLAELNPEVQAAGMIAGLRAIAEIAPDVPRIVGGGFLSLLKAGSLSFGDLAGHIVHDDGFHALTDVLESIVPGDALRNPEQVSSYAVRQLDLAPFIRPEPMIFGNEQPTLQIPTGHGCAKRCGFCHYEHMRPQLMRADEIVDVMDEITHRYGVRQLMLGELDFFTSRKRAVRVAQLLVDREVDVRWFALVSVQDILALSDDELALIKRSGCRMLEIGTESGSHEGLRLLGKTFTAADSIEASRRLLAHDIVPMHNILLGYVGEDASQRHDTVRLVRQLKSLDPKVRFNFRVYQATPTTTMGERAWRWMPALPTTVDELGAWRADVGRALPWLSARHEDESLFMADYVLPLAYDDALVNGGAGVVRRVLRAVARLRCRLGWFRGRLDRRLFRISESVGLPGTYLP